MHFPDEIFNRIKTFLIDYDFVYRIEQESKGRQNGFFSSSVFCSDLKWNGFTGFTCRRCKEHTRFFWDGEDFDAFIPICLECSSFRSFDSGYAYMFDWDGIYEDEEW